MCVFDDRSEEMSTRRYFVEYTDSSMQLWRVYCVGIGVLDLVINVNDLTWVKFHVPLIYDSSFQGCQDLSGESLIGEDGKIKSSVMCKESHFGFDIHSKIIYVD